jgi:hypothetical protein
MAVVAVVGSLERLVAEICHRIELPAAVGPHDDVRDRVRANGGRERAADGWRKIRHLDPLEGDRLLGTVGPQKVIPPRPGRQHDAVGLNRPAIGRDAANPATLDDQAGDLAAEPTVEAVLRSGGVPAEAHLLRVGEAAIGLVGGTGDAVERDLRLDRADLVGSQEPSVEAEARTSSTFPRQASTSRSGTVRR